MEQHPQLASPGDPSEDIWSYDLLKEHIQPMDENYSYSMPIWLMMYIGVLSTLIGITVIADYFYCKYKQTSSKPKIFSATQSRSNTKSVGTDVIPYI